MRSFVLRVLTAAGLLMALACTSGGGKTTPPAPAPAIASFAATQTAILSGTSTLLTAVFTNGTGSIDQGIGTVQSGVPTTTGALTATKTFTLTVTGTGAPATLQTTVTVIPAPAITQFTVAPATITAGSGAILAYAFSGGTGAINQGIGAVTSGATTNVAPAATTTYTLTVTGPNGTTPATAQATLTVLTPPPTRTVAGTVTYDFVPAVYAVATQVGSLDFAAAVPKPVRGGVVGVLNDTTFLATTTTDELGHYSLTYPIPASGSLQVVALASATSPAIIVQDNTNADALWAISVPLDAGTTKNLHATHGWTGTSYNAAARLAAPFAILDSMYTASRAFVAVRPNVVFPTLKVNWSPTNSPQAGEPTQGEIGTSHFSGDTNQIYILGKDGADTDEFDSHVIVHEWAHYFEHNLSRSDSPGGSHSFGDLTDPRLAFGEGFGTALAAILLPTPLYVDTLWSGGVLQAFGQDAETEPSPSDDPLPGPFSEATIVRLLYDIFDGGSTEPFDQVTVTLGVLYDVLVGPQKTTDALTTIASFITGLKAQPVVNGPALNTLLAHYEIGPITSQWGAGDPGLLSMFIPVNTLPYTGGVSLVGGSASNTYDQNQYWVVTGTGSPITVKTTCAQDVDIKIYRAGTLVGSAESVSGNELVQFQAQAGLKYVVVITGWGTTPGLYSVAVNLTTP